MTYETIDNITNQTLQGFLSFPTRGVPLFYPVILLAIYLVITFLTFFREVRREGRGNLISSFAVGGYVTTAIAFIFSLMNLVQTHVVIYVLVISIVFQAIFLLTRKEGS
jgi:putative exporter of polyketide antibiotics